MIKTMINKAGYRIDYPVLNNIKLDIESGEKILITGASGAGKTTLLLTITGVLSNLLNGVVEGTISINGIDPLNPRDFIKIPREIGVVLQDPEKQIAMPTPWDETVFTLENLGYSDEEILSRTRRVLSKYGLIDKAYHHVEELSGGEKRRLTIASATVHEPHILFLDEPSASMDPYGICSVRKDVMEYGLKGSTIILIEHKIKYFLDLVDYVIVLDRGRIQGVYEQASIDDKILSKFLEMGIDARDVDVVDHARGYGDEILRVRGLCIGYDQVVVRDIDLELHRGEVLAIVGRNGCGKTTLLKTLAGFVKPLGGEIFSRGKIFYVPQQPDYLFIEKSLEREVLEVSRKTGLDKEVLTSLIPWYERYRDVSPYRLSHGQRRWLSIIIGYGYSHDILLLDEPTTGLDYRLFRELETLINILREKGVGFIIATHDPRVVAEIADNVLYIENSVARYIDRGRAVEILEEKSRCL